MSRTVVIYAMVIITAMVIPGRNGKIWQFVNFVFSKEKDVHDFDSLSFITLRSLGGKLRIGLAEQSVLTSLGHAVVLTPPCQKEFPPEILDASKTLSSENLKEKMDEAALIIKTAYCELPTYNVIIPKLLEVDVTELPKYCHITPGRYCFNHSYFTQNKKSILSV